MSVQIASTLAKELADRYNSEGLSPFPFQHIVADRKDVRILLLDMPEGVSGATRFDKEKKQFEIFVCKSKPETRQHFTIAHEFGHYFLHADLIRSEEIVVDQDSTLDGNTTLFRLDQQQFSTIETEANNFAATLIMPEKLVRKAWGVLASIEECAKLFHVSASAMSIRLERLGLLYG